MYKCENCNQQMPANTPSQLFPIETRKKIYPPRFINTKHARGKSERYADKKHFDEGGTGFEIVREIRVCQRCADLLIISSSSSTA